MLSNIFEKTIYERRLSTLIWFIAIAVFSILVVVLFPTFRDSFGEALTNVPESMKSMLGQASDYQSINGYIDIQVVNQMVFLTLIMGIILGTSLLASEESDGTLQTLLTQPISRTKVYIQKFLALIVITFDVCMGVIVGVLAGAMFIGELNNINFTNLVLASIMIWLITLLFGALSFCIGAIAGKKSLAGILVGALAFITYMLTALSGTAEVLKTANNLSPFKYFNTPSVMKQGIETGNLMFFIISIIILALIGWIIFKSRDVYQK